MKETGMPSSRHISKGADSHIVYLDLPISFTYSKQAILRQIDVLLISQKF